MTKTLNLAATTLAGLLLLVMIALSLRGMLDPHAAAASFGVAVASPEAALYQNVYRSRNLVIALVGLIFLVARMHRALAIMTTAAIALPLFDIAFLKAAAMPVTVVHPATAAALIIVAALLWFRARSA